jgi:hypothetical protein
MKTKLASGRMEKRSAMAVPVHIKSLDRTQWVETAVTQNVSLFGARILVENAWGTGERITLQLSSGADPWAARVIYSQELRNGGIAIGVHLEKACPNWAGRNGGSG